MTTCNNCCGGENNCEANTIVVSNCCGWPEPATWEGGIDFQGELSSADLTSGGELVLTQQGVASALTPPNGTQRLYIFSYQVMVGVAGLFQLFENVTGDSSVPGGYAILSAGSMAQHGGLAQVLPNRFTRLAHTLHARHSAIGQVNVVVHGKLITEV